MSISIDSGASFDESRRPTLADRPCRQYVPPKMHSARCSLGNCHEIGERRQSCEKRKGNRVRRGNFIRSRFSHCAQLVPERYEYGLQSWHKSEKNNENVEKIELRKSKIAIFAFLNKFWHACIVSQAHSPLFIFTLAFRWVFHPRFFFANYQ